MADTMRTTAALQTLLADNIAGDISPQDLRDFLVSTIIIKDFTVVANTFLIGTASDTFTLTSFAANKFPARASSGNLVAKDISDFGLSLVDDADAAAARTTLGLSIGSNVQAYDAELAAIAGLTSAADKVPYFTGTGTAAVADFSSFGRSLVDDADAAAGRTTLGLGTMATQAAGAVAITGGTIVGLGSPSASNEAATKGYVDTLVAGLKWKASVKAATTANGTLATAFENGDTLDGVTLATGDRILIKDQTTATENGIYIVAASGAPTRATDADSGAELVDAVCVVEQGSVNADKAFTCTNDSITLGSTNLVWVNFASMITGALLATNNLSDLANAGTARTNLGLAIGTNVQAYSAVLTTWAGITPGTGVGTALAVNVGSAGAFVVLNGALGTPSGGTLTSCTGLPTAGLVDDAVTNAKLANMAASTINARKTGSTGDPEDCTVSEILNLIASVADGDILTRVSGSWVRLPIGTALHGLRVNAGGTALEYAAAGAGSADFLSTLTAAEIAITNASTALTVSRQHVITATSADQTNALPAASGNTGKRISVRIATSSTKYVTIDGNGSETIDGALTKVLWAGESITLLCDGSNWFIEAKNIKPMSGSMNRAAAQSYTTGSYAKRNVDTQNFDYGGMTDVSNSRFNCKRPGRYLCSVFGRFNASGSTEIVAGAFVGGSERFRASSTSASIQSAGVVQPLDLAAGDQVELYLYQSSGGTESTPTAGDAQPRITLSEIPA